MISAYQILGEEGTASASTAALPPSREKGRSLGRFVVLGGLAILIVGGFSVLLEALRLTFQKPPYFSAWRR